jgi:class 3 adenylate cyclase
MSELAPKPPSGTITFLFTDIVGSTENWEQHGDAFLPVLQAHNAILSEAVSRCNGYVMKTEGDSYKIAFADAADAARCAIIAQAALQRYPWPENVGQVRVRMGMHTGKPIMQGGDYFGPAVNRAARILSASHGGQVLLSEATLKAIGESAEIGTSFTDLGMHRLKDLGEGIHLYQIEHPRLNHRNFPPPRSLNGQPNNLPTQRRSFIGREKEIEQIAAGLGLGDRRLLTLTGPPGIGKTRLANQAAAEYAHLFPDGVWLVSLTGAMDVVGAAIEVAEALGIQIPPGAPALETVQKWLSSRSCLLILDDCTDVPQADRLIRELLSGANSLRCLATARHSLDIDEAHEIVVPELSLPPADGGAAEVMASDGGRLFVDRLVENQPDFTMNAQRGRGIARLLNKLQGGVPGNIEKTADALKSTRETVGKALSTLTDRLSTTAEDVGRHVSSGGRDLISRMRETPELAALLQGIGALAADRHKLDEAERLCRDALSVAREAEDGHGIAVSLRQLGNIAFAKREFERAVTLLSAASEAFHSVNSPEALAVRIDLEHARRAHGYDSAAARLSLDQALDAAGA